VNGFRNGVLVFRTENPRLPQHDSAKYPDLENITVGFRENPFSKHPEIFKKILDIFVLNLYYFSQSNLWKDRLMSVVLVVQNGSVFSTSQRFAQICRIRSHCGPLSPW
jgi:hypothetical protein